MARATRGKLNAEPLLIGEQLAKSLSKHTGNRLFKATKGSSGRREHVRSAVSAEIERLSKKALLASGTLAPSDYFKPDRSNWDPEASRSVSKEDFYSVCNLWLHYLGANTKTGGKDRKNEWKMFCEGFTEQQIADATGREQSAVHRTLETLKERCMEDYRAGMLTGSRRPAKKRDIQWPPDIEWALHIREAFGNQPMLDYSDFDSLASATCLDWLHCSDANVSTANGCTPEQNLKIYAMHAEGHSEVEISEALTLTKRQVCQSIKTLTARYGKHLEGRPRDEGTT